MGGEVSAPRRLPGIGESMAFDRLERVAGGGPRRAIVDDEQRAALGNDPAREQAGERDPGRRDFGRDTALAVEATALDRHHELAPRRIELRDRERIEKFVGDDQQRAFGQRGGIVVRARVRHPFGLGRAEHRAGLDEMDLRHQPGAAHGAQRIGGERAAPGPELDIGDAVRAAGATPQIGAPDADQLAEHLADLGRGREIAGRAKRIAGGVIKGVRRRHIIGDAHRALCLDPPAQIVFRWRPAHRRGPAGRAPRACSR